MSDNQIYDEIERFGNARPGRGESDHRYFPSDKHVEDCMAKIFAQLNGMFADTIFEDELEDMAWSMVNLFHGKIGRIDRLAGQIESDLRERVKEFDGSEISDTAISEGRIELEKLETLREGWQSVLDCAVAQYATATGKQWRPRRGSYRRGDRAITGATIELNTFLKARNQKRAQLVPDGSLVIVSGGTEITEADIAPIFTTLDKVRAKYPDMVVMHGGYNRGVDMATRSWADSRGVAEIYAGNAKNLYERNRRMLDAQPVGVVAFDGKSVTNDIVKQALARGIVVMDCRKRQ